MDLLNFPDLRNPESNCHTSHNEINQKKVLLLVFLMIQTKYTILDNQVAGNMV